MRPLDGSVAPAAKRRRTIAVTVEVDAARLEALVGLWNAQTHGRKYTPETLVREAVRREISPRRPERFAGVGGAEPERG